ncbi:NON RACE-SPECIFIC DISEASE RESISTANCE 1 family protein [Rhynchospora pubera]|uniref:NON RACE-SPECIFIC DISEASE RESISTANCE 1 family protein n=1 Tax=Rhynchospora pubera TaxID=906938 RepID=A0AAV8BR84_9POAL|nr:NON RACE-SPECIFIC DISEASE RESISTANCE 1 family protein [Rhynchospora pubera]
MADLADVRKYGVEAVNRAYIFKCCISLPILVILVVLLNIFHFSPLFYVRRLYIPALDKSLNSSTNASIIFDLSFLNMGKLSSVYFDPVNITFYDSPNQNHSIANFTIPEFTAESREPFEEGKVMSGAVNATGLDLEAAKREIATNGFKVFHLSAETSVRYDFYLFWKTKRYGYRSGEDVKIGDTGAANLGREMFVWFRVTLVGLVVIFLSTDIYF